VARGKARVLPLNDGPIRNTPAAGTRKIETVGVLAILVGACGLSCLPVRALAQADTRTGFRLY